MKNDIVAQRSEQGTHNPSVLGSSPSDITNLGERHIELCNEAKSSCKRLGVQLPDEGGQDKSEEISSFSYGLKSRLSRYFDSLAERTRQRPSKTYNAGSIPAGITLFIASIFLVACATPNLTSPQEPVVTATVYNGGFLFSQADKDFLVSEGIPSSYFTLTPRGWYMTKQDEIRAAELRASVRNGGVWK